MKRSESMPLQAWRVAFLRRHPDLPFAVAARCLGISRQRVSQLAQRAGIPSPPRQPARGRVGVCRDCGAVDVWINVRRYCRSCVERHAAEKAPLSVDLVCDYCGRSFTVVGRKRTEWLHNRRYFPGLRTRCAACAVQYNGNPGEPNPRKGDGMRGTKRKKRMST